MENKKLTEQVIVNKENLKKSIIVLDIIEAIEQFLKASKEINTIVDFEKKVKNFMTQGFPYKKDIDTLLSITSSTTNMKFFIDNLNNFQSIMQGYLNEEIRIIYKNFSIEDIHIKYSSLFYQFEILKNVILKSIINLETFEKENKNILDKEIFAKASNNLDKTIYYVENPPNWNKVLEQLIENSDEIVIL